MKGAGIDWELVHRRLRANERALEETLTENPERIEAVYRARAARLAKGKARPTPDGAGLPVLVFRLGTERYAIEAKEVAEVLIPERYTPAPGSPPAIAGVINVRGEIKAVVDPGRLVVRPGPVENAGFVLLLRRRGQEIGLKVDRVEEVREIRPDELSISATGKYVTGVASGMLLLLSVDALLAEVYQS